MSSDPRDLVLLDDPAPAYRRRTGVDVGDERLTHEDFVGVAWAFFTCCPGAASTGRDGVSRRRDVRVTAG